MKNKNIQFRATTGVVIPLLVACLGIFVSAATPASARDQVPFNGIVSGTIISTVPLDECHVLSEAVNGGNAMQLGRFNGTAEFVLNVCDLTYVGSYVFTGANGDSISRPLPARLATGAFALQSNCRSQRVCSAVSSEGSSPISSSISRRQSRESQGRRNP